MGDFRMEFEDAIEQLANGGSFDTFARVTINTWEAIARYLMRRWECPAGVTADDVTQELLMHTWIRLPKYDPSKGRSLKDFLVYNAASYAKKWIHKQRLGQRNRHDDKAESRFDIPVETIAEKSSDPTVLVGFVISLNLRQKRRPKFRKVLGKLCDADFNTKKAVDLLVAEGTARTKAEKLVSTTMKEINTLW